MGHDRARAGGFGSGRKLQSGELNRRWQEALARHPQAAAWLDALGRRVDLKALAGEWSGGAANVLRGVLAGSVAAATGWLIMIFILFFFLRDRDRVLATVERYLPLSPAEIQEVYKVTADTVHATVYGTLGVAVVQGTLGGLVFWWVGLPAPMLWGAVMGVLSVLPVLGAALVWAPVAGYLALQGQWGDALLLAAFGAIVIGLVDNLVYPADRQGPHPAACGAGVRRGDRRAGRVRRVRGRARPAAARDHRCAGQAVAPAHGPRRDLVRGPALPGRARAYRPLRWRCTARSRSRGSSHGSGQIGRSASRCYSAPAKVARQQVGLADVLVRAADGRGSISIARL
jgi:hypothetical protein